MRQGPQNGRRPRSRHHSGGHNGGHSNGGGNGAGGNTNPTNNSGNGGGNRPRSAASLRHQNFDSNCIEMRVRGNAWQVHEKYQALARDATSSGDRVAAENYLQHAEHYYRIIEAINEATAQEQRLEQRPPRAPGNFDQQPAVPPNYYGGASSAPGPSATPAQGAQDADGGVSGNVMPVAEADSSSPQKSAFFTPDEVDENSPPEARVAQR